MPSGTRVPVDTREAVSSCSGLRPWRLRGREPLLPAPPREKEEMDALSSQLRAKASAAAPPSPLSSSRGSSGGDGFLDSGSNSVEPCRAGGGLGRL
jgi:hypothetical protein